MAADDGEPRAELRALVGQLRTNLSRRQRSGLQGVPRTPSARRAVVAPTPAPAAAPAGGARAASAAPVEPAEDGAGRPTGGRGLALVREDLGDCQRCKLAPLRTNLVFGVGNPNAHLVFVGEAPGADEDAQGEPFVGKAGQLLTKMIEAMGYAREDVYICNILKCRPPGNRNPEPDEIARCEPFLKAQLAALRPRMIVALGKFAAQCLLRDDTPISRLRGAFRSYEGIQLMPTFHPAYLLRDPTKKKEAWADLKAVNAALARLGIDPPRPPAGGS
ncbi:MAG TPA: uracil-DNA glycosylase [Polyangia bacterium]|nr:uracil-DNA glycosylase [Polyangia bacterium]